MNLFDLLACPTCKTAVHRIDQVLICSNCNRNYPIINNVPVLLPDGSIPDTLYQHELNVRPQYDPWIHRVVLQSLPNSAIVLDLGAGNFSLAVIEHLRQPFQAAEEMYAALRPGGYVYGECNFVFAYHGYPHHYFNASEQGLEQVFQSFCQLRTGVAPYQMPSFALRMFVQTFLQNFEAPESPDTITFRQLLQNVVDQPLGVYDGYITEEQALRTAAGVYFFGYKAAEYTDVIPEPVQAAWNADRNLQAQFPRLHDLGRAPNIMQWAKTTGRQQQKTIDTYFNTLQPFEKDSAVAHEDQIIFDSWQVVDPAFGNINDAARDVAFTRPIMHGNKTIAEWESLVATKDAHIAKLETLLQRIEQGRVMQILRRFTR